MRWHSFGALLSGICCVVLDNRWVRFLQTVGRRNNQPIIASRMPGWTIPLKGPLRHNCRLVQEEVCTEGDKLLVMAWCQSFIEKANLLRFH